MKTIIAGGRDITDYNAVVEAMFEFRCDHIVTEIVSGAARGVDALGERWAREHKVALKRFPADWDQFGKSAGPRRNREMAKYAEALVAIWDGQSKGTGGMIREAKQHGLIVHVFKL